MKKNYLPLIGAHVSTSGGLYTAVERATVTGCNVIQIFTKSNRQWAAKPLTQEEIDLFKTTVAQSNIQAVVTHACYLINLAAADELIYQKSIEALTIEVLRCEQLNIPYLVLHPGSSGTTQNGAQAIEKIIKGLQVVLKKTSGKTMILLETMAGQGSSVCATFENMAAILNPSKRSKRIGVCVDTCHIFAAGYDFSTNEAYEKLWNDFDAIIGLEYLKVFHLNDSKKERGSRIDRHEDIGKGFIGSYPFELLLNDVRFITVPKILETPQNERPLEDVARNIKVLQSLIHTD